jgi:drug/metabolite transporter (DMT)-like permease
VPITIVAFIICSACIHVGWNLLLKGAANRQLTTFLAVSCAGLVMLPWAWSRVDGQVWLIAMASAVFQALYYILLAYGYDNYDLGVLYPIARGVAPLLSAIWATMWLGDQMHAGGIVAVLVITSGTIWIGVRHRAPGLPWRMPWLPLIIALAISGYTIIDALGARSGDTLAYYSVCTLWKQQPTWALVRSEFPRAALIGGLSFVSYMMILLSYAKAPVSYVAAMREISIVIAGLVGWLWLKESFGSTRLIGATVVSVGVALLVLLG